MQSESAIYKADYLEFVFTDSGGDTTITFDNREIRGDISYFIGFNTQKFVTPTGQTSVMSESTGKYIEFTLRVHEDAGTRYKYNQIQHITRAAYSCTMTMPYLWHDLSSEPSNPVQTLQTDWGKTILTFGNCVFEIPDDSTDKSARGEGATFTEVTIRVHENSAELFEIQPDYLAGDYAAADYKTT